MASSTSAACAAVAAVPPYAEPRRPWEAGASAIAAPDHRADGQRRMVSLSRDCIRIDRQLAGIAMRVAVPVRSYRGVALSLLPDAAGALSYQLHLMHADADLSVALEHGGDEAGVVADWRLWSRFFRLPALVEREAGQIEPADPMLGGLPVGRAGSVRRRSRFRSKRRPKFLARRLPGDTRLSGTVHAGEREIIARA